MRQRLHPQQSQQGNPLAFPGAAGGDLFSKLAGAFGSPVPQGAQNALAGIYGGGNPGQSIVNAYQPIFQRNLALAQDQGPRFSSGNELLRTQSMNDFNMFAQQALQQGQQRQLEAAMGAGQLGINSQLPLMQQLLAALFQGGGINSGPIYNVQPGLGQQLLGLGGMLGGAALGGGFGRGAGGGGTISGSGGHIINDPFGGLG